MPNPIPTLSLLETRVLGTLAEKEKTVPDAYPLTLNALVAGCNQKTSRSPVLEATETQVQEALDRLKAANLVIESSGGRVARYSHNLERVLEVPSQSAAILTALMLRGPQTSGELRINCERLHRFADISAVEGFLEELAARPAGALVTQLPRVPGARENRWAHLLSGAPKAEAPAQATPPARGKKTIVQVPDMGEAAGPFSRAVRVGNHLYIAGTTALSHLSGDYYRREVPPDIEAQTRLTLENIRKCVEAAGGTLQDVFKVVIMLKNPADYRRMNAVRAEFFPAEQPISTCYQADLMREDILVEIEAVAVLD